MIWLLNRREVFMSGDVAAFARARELLSAANIPYRYRVASAGGQDGSRGREMPLHGNPQMLYYVYVHKKDYVRAAACIGKPGCAR